MKISIAALLMLITISCQQKRNDSSQSNPNVLSKEVKGENHKVIFNNLDKILSPFEDMTEYALDKNENGVLKSLSKIEKANSNGYFDKNLTTEGSKLIQTKIEKLKELISQKDYSQVALTSTEIFEYNITNFTDGNLIKNQIQIEHLDYMGFKILALLNQEQINWDKIKQTIDKTQKIWLALNPKVNDVNLKDTFNYLFKGLLLSTKNKDIKMCGIFANMDLAMVDVLENTI